MLHKFLKILLLAVALTPLIYTPSLIFPFVMGKGLFFRAIIELALVLFLILLVRSSDLRGRLKIIVKNPLFILAALFLISAAISTVLAVNPYRSFWGEVERMEGLFGLLHYFVFFAMAATIFEKKDWIKFLKISLIAALIIIFFGLLQFFNVESAITFPVRGRPDAFLGNSSYLGTHFLFILAFAAIIWRRWALAIGVLSVIMIFLTATRGAIVGLFVGALFVLVYYRKQIIARKGALWLVAAAIVLLAVFGLTKNQPFWQAIPGFDRLANISLSHPTVQSRLLSLGSSWEALKERPLFGWGIDNFNIAYNKYYNPDSALYERAWFDRAHNKVADVAVMQGIFGLFIYLALISWAFRKANVPIKFLLVAYFVQNLFVFDQINSYVMFFAVLGFVVGTGTSNVPDIIDHRKTKSLATALTLVIVAPLVIYSLYFYHFIPYVQSRRFIVTATTTDDANAIAQTADKFLAPYNFSQITLRNMFHDFLVRANAFKNEELNFLTDKSLAALEEVADKEPYDPRTFIRLSEGYNDRGKKDISFLARSEAALRQALELAPTRQDVYYHLAYTLSSQGKHEEAIATAREAVELSPDAGRSHYILGVVLSLAGNRLEGEQELEKGLALGKQSLLDQDYQNLISIYSANLIYNIKRRDSEAVLRIVDTLKEIKPDLTKQLDVIVDLVNQRRWGQVETLLGT